MKLYVLNYPKASYDENGGFVIRASSSLSARKIASQNHSDEGAEVWLDKTKTTCSQILEEGELEIILTDFRAG